MRKNNEFATVVTIDGIEVFITEKEYARLVKRANRKARFEKIAAEMENDTNIYTFRMLCNKFGISATDTLAIFELKKANIIRTLDCKPFGITLYTSSNNTNRYDFNVSSIEERIKLDKYIIDKFIEKSNLMMTKTKKIFVLN